MSAGEEYVERIDRAYDRATGFLGLLRLGTFDRNAYERLMAELDEIDIGDASSISRRLVSLLWYMPQFIAWQADRVADKGGDREAVLAASDGVRTRIETILGVP